MQRGVAPPALSLWLLAIVLALLTGPLSVAATSPRRIRGISPNWTYLYSNDPSRPAPWYPPVDPAADPDAKAAAASVDAANDPAVAPSVTDDSAISGPQFSPEAVSIFGDGLVSPDYTLTSATVAGAACVDFSSIHSPLGDDDAPPIGVSCLLDASSVSSQTRTSLTEAGVHVGGVSLLFTVNATGATKTLFLPHSFTIYQPSLVSVTPPRVFIGSTAPVRLVWRGAHPSHWSRVAVSLAGVPATVSRATGHYLLVTPGTPEDVEETVGKGPGEVRVTFLSSPLSSPSSSSLSLPSFSVAAEGDTLEGAPLESDLLEGDSILHEAHVPALAEAFAYALPVPVSPAEDGEGSGDGDRGVVAVHSVTPSWSWVSAASVNTLSAPASDSSTTGTSTGTTVRTTTASELSVGSDSPSVRLTLRGSGFPPSATTSVTVNGLPCSNVHVTGEGGTKLTCALPRCDSSHSSSPSSLSCVGAGWVVVRRLSASHSEIIATAGFQFVRQPSFEAISPGQDLCYDSNVTLNLFLTEYTPSVPFLVDVAGQRVPDTATVTLLGSSTAPSVLRFTLLSCPSCSSPVSGTLALLDVSAALPPLPVVPVARVPAPSPSVYAVSPSAVVLGDEQHTLTLLGESLLRVASVAITVETPASATPGKGNGRKSVPLLINPNFRRTDTKLTGSFPFCGSNEAACLPGQYRLELYDSAGALLTRTPTRIGLVYNPRRVLQVQLLFAAPRAALIASAGVGSAAAFAERVRRAAGAALDEVFAAPEEEQDERRVQQVVQQSAETVSSAASSFVDLTTLTDEDDPSPLPESVLPRLLVKYSPRWRSVLRGSTVTRVVLILTRPPRNDPPSPRALARALIAAARNRLSALKVEFPSLDGERCGVVRGAHDTEGGGEDAADGGATPSPSPNPSPTPAPTPAPMSRSSSSRDAGAGPHVGPRADPSVGAGMSVDMGVGASLGADDGGDDIWLGRGLMRCALRSYKRDCSLTDWEEDAADESCTDCEPGLTPFPGGGTDGDGSGEGKPPDGDGDGKGDSPGGVLSVGQTVLLVLLGVIVGGGAVAVLITRLRTRPPAPPAGGLPTALQPGGSTERELAALDPARVSLGRSIDNGAGRSDAPFANAV